MLDDDDDDGDDDDDDDDDVDVAWCDVTWHDMCNMVLARDHTAPRSVTQRLNVVLCYHHRASGLASKKGR
jgi:hypothetical protein